MRVSDIYEEVKEATGSCDEAVNLRAITRAVELLANEGSFDPLLGTIDFVTEGAHLLALPRDVKTPLRLNINNNPAFARSRIFEFMPNANGSVDGPEVGWQWHERGYSCIQDETKLPSKLRYHTEAADAGRSVKIVGKDTAGRTRTETLLGAAADHPVTKYAYAEINHVIREATTEEAYLWAETGSIARYYADEEQPEYRVIKLSQSGVAVRMLYRKHVFKITSQEDIIPLHSAMAVIRAVEAVRMMQKGKFVEGQAVLTEAVRIIGKEQESRDEGNAVAGAIEVQSAINASITTTDVLIVADVYDMAAEILGPIGRQKIFDRLTDAIEILQNKGQWDSLIGECVLSRCAHLDYADGVNRKCGYFVLPRSIGAVLAVNDGGLPTMPRNRWYEYHLNGPGESRWCMSGWQDKGDTCTINGLPRDGNKIIPVRLLAIPDIALDEDKKVTVYGVERREDGSEVAIHRDGKPGYVVPCKYGPYSIPADAPKVVRIDRISREGTAGFVKLAGAPINGSTSILLGFWQPEELEPRYRMIRLGGYGHGCVRIRYRKRAARITSLYDVINLRSRLAIENILRALVKQKEDPAAAELFEQKAISYLEDEQHAMNPHTAATLQFAPGMAPGDFYSIQ